MTYKWVILIEVSKTFDFVLVSDGDVKCQSRKDHRKKNAGYKQKRKLPDDGTLGQTVE